MILEDDELNSPSLEANDVSASVHAGTDSTFELNRPTDPPNREARYDVEDSLSVGEHRNQAVLQLLPERRRGTALDNVASLTLSLSYSITRPDQQR